MNNKEIRSKDEKQLNNDNRSLSKKDEIKPAEVSENLVLDPEYLELIDNYQAANWDTCCRLLEKLSEKYPNNDTILELFDEIQLKKRLLENEKNFNQQENDSRKKKKVRIFLSVMYGILLGVAAIIGLFYLPSLSNSRSDEKAQSEKEHQLVQLEEQSRNLIRVGNTELAIDTVKKIEAMDPLYPNLEELIIETVKLEKLDQLYYEGLHLLDEGKPDEALQLFNQINGVNSQYKDINNQILQINNKKLTEQLLNDGNNAYLENRWDEVITAYEKVLSINPAIINPNLEEQLFMGYYEKIRSILLSENPTIEEIDNSEIYYRKAVSLVAQDRTFSQERRNLQQFLVGLLTMKYRQIAGSIIESPFITEEYLTKAVDYLRKAINLSPSDISIKNELDRAQIFLLGFQKFNRMEWDIAITNLEKLDARQGNYAGGMNKQMLYEAYSARGQRYLNAGYFVDAQQDFEKAEIIAWENRGNKLQLYEAQVNMGMVLGKMQNYRDSITYFNLALDSINAASLIMDRETSQELVNTRLSADINKNYAVYEGYLNIIPELSDIYVYKEVNVGKGQSLAGIAKTYGSTVQAIRLKNNLPDTMVSKTETTLLVPIIQ